MAENLERLITKNTKIHDQERNNNSDRRINMTKLGLKKSIHETTINNDLVRLSNCCTRNANKKLVNKT